MATAVTRSSPTPKPYRVRVEKRPDYLYAQVSGNALGRDTTVEYLREITEACRRYQCTNVIIDNTMPPSFAISDLFFVATRFPRFGVELTKVAIVDKELQTSDRDEFSVMVGRKAGLDVHIFSNIRQAEKWISRDS